MFSKLRFFLYCDVTDMRKSFDALSGIIRSTLDKDPLGGDVFVFINRRRNRMKLLVWEQTGFWLLYKRLEKGTFQFPVHSEEQPDIQISYDELLMIVQGIDLNFVKRRPRFQYSES
jgi:transposase